VSPDTRQILLSGENPLAATLGAETTKGTMADADQRGPGRPAQNVRPRAALQGALGRPVQLEGLAQMVGLAIGAPEFQRR
jgi:hypothetical protein